LDLLGKRTVAVYGGILAISILVATSVSRGQDTAQFQASSASSSFIRIDHSIHPLASHPLHTQVSDAGRVEDGRVIERMLLTLSPGADKQEALRKYLDDQQNHASGNYHHWLTSVEYGAKFGAEATDIQRARAWLEKSGFSISAVAKSGRWIEFTGTTRQVNQAFRTELRYFVVAGKRYVANATDISLPESIAQVSRGLVSLNNFPKHPLNHFTGAGANGSIGSQRASLTPNLTAGGNPNSYFVSPGDFAMIYNTKPLLNSGNDGSGVAIAVTGQSQIELTDVQAFRQIFQLKVNDPNIILSGPDPGVTNPIDQQEATLDVEWAGAVAPGATIDLVIAGTTDATNGVDLAAAYVIDNQIAPILTYTYGGCELALGASGNAFYNSLWQQAAAEGITVLVASGDDGSAGCDASNSVTPAVGGLAINGAASTAYNVAVGGTEFTESADPTNYWSGANDNTYTSALGYIPEAVWNEACDSTIPLSSTNCIFNNLNFSMLAGGGGASTIYAKPLWQTGTGVPADGARDIPDVAFASAFNHDGIVYCNSLGGKPCEVDSQKNVSGLVVVGGTSASTPAMAGVLALIEQKNGAFQGQINYTLYNLAQTNSCNSSNQTNPTAQNSCAFYDVTSGSNAVPCAGTTANCMSSQANVDGSMSGQAAGVGYDMATGLGSVNATNLANDWKNLTYTPSQTLLQIPTTSFAHGTSITVTGTVAPASGMGPPTGAISLKTGTFGNTDVLPIIGGSFTGSVADLPGGQYTVVAHYAGDGTFAASDSNSITVNVTPEASTTSLTAQGLQGSSVPYGNLVQFDAKVQGISATGIATGAVTLLDGTTVIGTYALAADGGAYTSTGSGASYSFPVGAHSVTASYAGDNSFNASTSAPVTFNVGKSSPLVIVGVNQTSVNSTQPIGAHAVVTGFGTAFATGPVQFTVDGLPYGASIPLQTGGFFGTQAQAAILITGLSAGTHKIGVNYDGSGDPNFSSVVNTDSNHEPNNPTVTVTAGVGAATTTTLTAVTLPINLGDNGKFTVTLSPNAATGTVTLWDAVGARSTPTSITGGSATIQFPWTQGGTTSLYAVYSGDATSAPSSSTSISFTVKPGVPMVALSAPAQSSPSQQISLDATLTGINSAGMPAGSSLPYPTGIVQVTDSLNGGPPQLLAVQNLTAGGAYTSVYGLRAKLAVGTHTLKAHYGGDNNWQAADSPNVTVVSAAVSDFALSLSPNSVAFAAGGTGSTMATITPSGGFAGNVTLSCPSGSAFPIAGYNCAFVPSPAVNITGTAAGSATLNLTPATSSAGAIVVPRATFRFEPGLWILALGAGLLFLGIAAWGSIDAKPARQFAWASGWILCAASLVFGCGGGGGGSSGGGGKVFSTTTLTSSNLHSTSQFPVIFNIVIKANSTPGGTVQLLDNGQIYSAGTVSAGVAIFETTTLPVGVHVIVAQYSGDANTLPSSSAPITQIVAGSVQIPVTATSSGGTHTTTLTVAVN
jgi:Pro-kumamolisin, activation domain/Bacterial Ig-like domain (group 3)